MSNKYLEKIAKTLDEIEDDRSTAMRRITYLPAVGAAAGVAYASKDLGKLTQAPLLPRGYDQNAKARMVHLITRPQAYGPSYRNAYLGKLGKSVAIGASVAAATTPYIKNTLEEKYRLERRARRGELVENRRARREGVV